MSAATTPAAMGPPRAAARPGATARTARALALAALLVYVATGGGRIVGSDEVAMLDLARAMLRGHIGVAEGSTQPGREGRTFTKNAAGQAILALPIVALSESGAARLAEPRRTLAVRFGASFFNAIVTALLLAGFYVAARALGAGTIAAFDAALLLGFTTPVWVYAKSFMAEPLQALGLLLALAGAARASTGHRRPDGRWSARAALVAGLGAFIAVSVKLSMLPIAVACLAPLAASPRRLVWPLGGLVLALAGHGIYDLARFGTPFETGYGAQATSILGALGAEVIRVESRTRPDPVRMIPPHVPVPGEADGGEGLSASMVASKGFDRGAIFHKYNFGGKRSIALNLKHPRGMEILERLVACCDVLAESFSAGALERMGPDDVLERDALERLAAGGELFAFRHEGFWDCMDTYKDTLLLNELWERGEAPWRALVGA